MENTGEFVNVGGQLYAICEEGGRRFIFDPHHDLAGPHVAASMAAKVNSGLGAANVPLAVGTTALSYIPVVGPILSAVANAIFSGGDPTPIKDIAMQAVNDRVALKNARVNVGIPDAFDLALVMSRYDADMSDQASAGPMIAQEILGRPITPFNTARHDIKRDDYKAAIAKMEQETAQLVGMARSYGIVTPGAIPGQAAGVTPAKSSLLPWLLPAAALAFYAFVA